MEGACIITYDSPILIIYKEISKNNILLVIYCDKQLKYTNITCKQLTNIIPVDAIHILTKLPYYNDLNITLKFWKIKVYNKLITLNK